MIISALSTLLLDTGTNLSEIVRYYPSVSYRDDDGKMKSEIVNRYFVMFQGEIPKGRTKSEIE